MSEELCRVMVNDRKGDVESISEYNTQRMARMATKKSIFIPKGSILVGGLVKIECPLPFLELVFSIGKDHTARLLISEDALCALNKLEPDVTIF